jgi:hypothetical protein
MPGWEIVFGAREIELDGRSGPTVGWSFELERGSERRTITVEVARDLITSDKSTAPDDVRRALTTRGSSAVMAVLDRDPLPSKLVIDRRGIEEFT